MKRLPLSILLMSSCTVCAACDRNSDDRSDTGIQASQPERTDTPTLAHDSLRIDPSNDDLEDRAEDKKEAVELVEKSANTLEEMKKDDNVKKLLAKARGVFIVPRYARGAVGVGVRGGEGILIAHRDGQAWSDPTFYDVGAISAGAQLGAEGGEIAMLLMDDRALNAFKSDGKFSLNADAAFTLVDFSTLSQASVDKDSGNVIFWSNTKGAFAGVSLSASDLMWDEEVNAAYYGKPIKVLDALEGRAKAPQGKLQRELNEI